MIRGERRTINMPTVLYPGRDTVVRVGRHNARVDEGYNEVVALNGEEVMEQYKGWVVVMDSVSNGEAFIIVRNNSEQAISLPAGTLNIAIRPTICLPRILSRADVQKVDAAKSEPEDPAADPNSPACNRVMTTLSEHHSVAGAVPETKDSTTFFSWNCNGFGSRVKGSDLEARFYSQLSKLDPDVVSLQEIRRQCKPEHPSEILPGSKDESQWETFMEPLRERYDVYLTLSSRRYGGHAVLVKKGLTPPRVTYNMGTNTGHYGSGRFMKLEFTNIVIRSVYAPFNGVGKEEQLQRRRDWDERLYHELTHELDPTKGRVVLGDFNAVYRESDMSNDTSFWKRQGAQDIAEADRGFGGTTTNERRRFRDILECGELADSFTVPTGNKLEARWRFRGQGKFHGKGLKLDYIFADDTILLSGGVKSSRILCNGRDRDGFMGSDHAPLFCELHPRWNRKQSNLRAHYGAALRSTESQLTQLVRTQEETIQVANMFANTIARQSLPKSREGRVEPSELKGDGRPAGISDILWSELGQSVKEKVILNVAGYEAEYVTDCIHRKLEAVRGGKDG
jgi:exodeoxyribonuclease III